MQKPAPEGQTHTETASVEEPQPHRKSLAQKGTVQFLGQAFGLVLAVLVSHLIARRLGVGLEADAFILGRRLITAVTETLNQVVSIVFVPLVAAQAAAGAGLWVILRRAAGPAFLVGALLAVLFIVSAPALVSIVAADFAEPAKALAARVMIALSLALPASVITMALVSYCNINDIFGTPAALKQLPRAGVALALILAVEGSVAITAAWAYTGAAFAVVALILGLILLKAAPHSKIKPASVPTQSAATARRGLAAMIIAGAALTFLWMETYVAASLGPGSVATLDYGQRLGALLGNTLATALGLVVFVDLARRAASGEEHTLGTAFRSAAINGVALTIPIAVGVAINAGAMVDLVLGYGAFTENSQRDEVVRLVQLMALAPVPALVLRIMYARIVADAALPMVRLLLLAMAADFIARVLMFWLLTSVLGLAGIAVTLICAPVFTGLALIIALRGQGVFGSGMPSLAPMRKMLILSGMTVAALVIGAALADQLVAEVQGKSKAAIELGISGGLGIAVALATILGLRIKPKLTSS